MKFKNIPKWTL